MTPEKPRHDGECSTTAVLPCPFCGSAARLVHPHDSSMGYVLCGECYASSKPSDDSVTVRLWNTRPTLGTQEGGKREPENIACDIVSRFAWSSNVIHEGRLVGQQYVVMLAIAEAIKAERNQAASHARTIAALRALLEQVLDDVVKGGLCVLCRYIEPHHHSECPVPNIRRALKEHPNG